MSGRTHVAETSPERGTRPGGPPAPGNALVVAPSLLSCDFAHLADEVGRAEAAGADWHHVDVMDGHFVPNLTIGPVVVRHIQDVARVPLDVHLMITDPVRYAPEFVKAGAHVLTFHVETCAGDEAAREAARALRSAGAPEVGVSLNPDTPVERVRPLLDLVDLVLVMSVFPGFGGQRFMPEVLPKTARLREWGYAGRVEMDGGIDLETLPRCVAAGADTLVAGTALYRAPDMAERVRRFRALAREAGARVEDSPGAGEGER